MDIRFEIHPFNQGDSLNCPIEDDFKIVVYYQGEKIAYLMCYHELGKIWAFESFVEESYRRQGIGTKMYDYAMEVSERTILPHHENPHNADPDNVTNDALEFWKNRK